MIIDIIGFFVLGYNSLKYLRILQDDYSVTYTFLFMFVGAWTGLSAAMFLFDCAAGYWL